TVTLVNPAFRGDQAPNQRVFPFNQYAGISIGAFTGSSNYNGMVLTFRKKASHGITFDASYTWARSMDLNSAFFGSDGESGAFADPHHPELDYGRSAFDVRQRFVISYNLEAPVGRGKRILGNANGAVDAVLGGWSLSGITQYRTGFPFTIF